MKTTDFIKEDIGEDAHAMHQDHEVQMARQDCYNAAKDAIALHKLLKNISEVQGLDGWVSEKLTLAADYLKTVHDYLEYEMLAQKESMLPAFEMESAEQKLGQALNEEAGLGDSAVQDAIMGTVEKLFHKNEISDYGALEAVRQGVKHHFSKPGATVDSAVAGILNILNKRMSKSGDYLDLGRFKEALRQGIAHQLKKQGVAEEQLNELNVKQIKKDLDSGMSTDAVIGKHANKTTSNTDQIRKLIQQYAWEKRMKQGVAEGYTGRETKHGTWRVFKDGDPVAVAGPFNSREEASAWIKKQKQSVAEGEYNPDTFVPKQMSYKGYGLRQDGPYEWSVSASARKFPTLAAAKRHIDKHLILDEGFPYDVDHMPGPVVRDADMVTDNVKTKDKAEWSRAVDSINSKVFDDMAELISDNKGKKAASNGKVWAKWDNATQTGWFNAKGRPLKPWPVKEQTVTEDASNLTIGDPVIITGNVEHEGSAGEIVNFGKDKSFVIVNLYGHGTRSFQAANVRYDHESDLAGDDEEEDDDQDDGFYVAISDEDDGVFIGAFAKEGGRWREQQVSGKAPYGWGGTFMSYLTPGDIMQHLRNDYRRGYEVKGPMTWDEAQEYAESMAESSSRSIKEVKVKDVIPNGNGATDDPRIKLKKIKNKIKEYEDLIKQHSDGITARVSDIIAKRDRLVKQKEKLEKMGVKEDASAGASSAGAVATVAVPLMKRPIKRKMR